MRIVGYENKNHPEDYSGFYKIATATSSVSGVRLLELTAHPMVASR